MVESVDDEKVDTYSSNSIFLVKLVLGDGYRENQCYFVTIL